MCVSRDCIGLLALCIYVHKDIVTCPLNYKFGSTIGDIMYCHKLSLDIKLS